MRHARLCLTQDDSPLPVEPDEKPMPLAGSDTPSDPTPSQGSGSSKIHVFEQTLISGKHEDKWNRSPNATGTGAIHVRSFHAKMTEESLHNLDRQINEWLDAHPQYEVKLVTTSIGEWKGKMKEPNLIVQVWV